MHSVVLTDVGMSFVRAASPHLSETTLRKTNECVCGRPEIREEKTRWKTSIGDVRNTSQCLLKIVKWQLFVIHEF
jgi:hypothetical protein